jgi:phosphoenolpyruvate---glycerone phosphotransferase subunit DhaL
MRHAMETAMNPAGTARPPETDFSLRVLRAVAETVIAHAEELTALDQAIGDGDHGINMKRGLEAVLAACPEFEGQPPGEVLKAAGMKLVMKVGGASGPLYGTLAMELGKRVPASPSRGDWAAALAAAIEAVKTRGKSDVGQKTMLDVLVPVQAKFAEGADAGAVRREALDAAKATAPLRATRGRASFLGERSVGHVDPGARSAALIVAAVCDTLEE